MILCIYTGIRAQLAIVSESGFDVDVNRKHAWAVRSIVGVTFCERVYHSFGRVGEGRCGFLEDQKGMVVCTRDCVHFRGRTVIIMCIILYYTRWSG